MTSRSSTPTTSPQERADATSSAGRLVRRRAGLARPAGRLHRRPAGAVSGTRRRAAPRRRRSSPSAPASIRATPGSGSSTRRSARSLTWTTVAAAPDERRYALPAGHAAVLIDPESLALVAPLARFVVGTAKTMPELLDAYRTGEGVDWADYGPDVVEAQEGSTGRSSTISSASGSTRCRTSRSGCGAARSRCGRRLRHRLVVDRHRPPFPGRRGRRHRHRRGLDRARQGPRRRGRRRRSGVVPVRRRGERGRRGSLRPHDDLRGSPRHGPAGRGTRGGQAAARAGRCGAHRRRARSGDVHRARATRPSGCSTATASWRASPTAWSTSRPSGPARSCAQRRSSRSPARPATPVHEPSDRARQLPLLPARSLGGERPVDGAQPGAILARTDRPGKRDRVDPDSASSLHSREVSLAPPGARWLGGNRGGTRTGA